MPKTLVKDGLSLERRSTPKTAAKLEARQSGSEDSAGTLSGLAAVFNSRSEPLEGPNGRTFREVILPGAFDAVLSRDTDVLCLRNHDRDNLLAREGNGTLELEADGEGLHYRAEVTDTSTGRDTVALGRRGDLSGNSFTFAVAQGGDEWRQSGGTWIREIHEVATIGDVGPVTSPAYLETTLSARCRKRAAHAFRAAGPPRRRGRKMEGRKLASGMVSRSLRRLQRDWPEAYQSSFALAVHEGGHAVASWALGHDIESVEIRWGDEPHTSWYQATSGKVRWSDADAISNRDAAVIYAAGEIAEDISSFTGNGPDWCREDRHNLRCCLSGCGELDEKAIRAEAREIVEGAWNGVDWIVGQAMRRGRCSIPGDEFAAYMDRLGTADRSTFQGHQRRQFNKRQRARGGWW